MAQQFKYLLTNAGSKCDGCAATNKKLDNMKETLEQQNMKICEILAEHSVLLKQLLDKDKVIDTVMKIFPINSESQLHELEKLLEGQKDLYIRYLTSLIRGDISKNIGKILGREIIMAFNVEGVQGNKRLRDFKNVYDAICDVISDPQPEGKLKAALQQEKRKYHNINSRHRSKENRQQPNLDSHEEPNTSTN